MIEEGFINVLREKVTAHHERLRSNEWVHFTKNIRSTLLSSAEAGVITTRIPIKYPENEQKAKEFLEKLGFTVATYGSRDGSGIQITF